MLNRLLQRYFILTLIIVFLLPLIGNSQQNSLDRLIQRAKNETVREKKQNPSLVKIARLHYSGGGDWYWGRSAVPNMLCFARDNSNLPIDTIEYEISLSDPELFKYPFLFATGHGTIQFEVDELERLRKYLLGGGFLFVNDSYGMSDSFKKEMAKIFPEREVVDIPFDHELYHSFYDFPGGPPKIHEHDNKAPRGYGIIVNGRLVVYFLVESDIGDGWEDSSVHNDPEDKRTEAFKMGMNILTYALLN